MLFNGWCFYIAFEVQALFLCRYDVKLYFSRKERPISSRDFSQAYLLFIAQNTRVLTARKQDRLEDDEDARVVGGRCHLRLSYPGDRRMVAWLLSLVLCFG